jgi:putative transposase
MVYYVAVLVRAFSYPLHPTKAQETALERILVLCQRLYNGALEERIGAWRLAKETLSLYDQQVELTELRAQDPEYDQVSARILRSPLQRLDRAYKGFFRRVKRGEKPGFPRFKSRDRYNSFSFPNPVLKGNFLTIPSFGPVKLRLYRPLRGIPKEAQVRKTAKGWTVSIVCDLGAAPPVSVDLTKSTGIDVGITTFGTLSDGSEIPNPRFFRESEAKLARRQQILQRKKRGSNSRRRAKNQVGRVHLSIRNQRLDHARKTAKSLFDRFDVVCHEDLNIRNMVRNTHLSKSISDAAWGQFILCLAFKAEEAGKLSVGVNPRGTSQRCSGCGKVCPKTLSDREHRCPSCGLVIGRDHNAAINIWRLGLSLVSRPQSKDCGLAKAYKAKPMSERFIRAYQHADVTTLRDEYGVSIAIVKIA